MIRVLLMPYSLNPYPSTAIALQTLCSGAFRVRGNSALLFRVLRFRCRAWGLGVQNLGFRFQGLGFCDTGVSGCEQSITFS